MDCPAIGPGSRLGFRCRGSTEFVVCQPPYVPGEPPASPTPRRTATEIVCTGATTGLRVTCGLSTDDPDSVRRVPASTLYDGAGTCRCGGRHMATSWRTPML